MLCTARRLAWGSALLVALVAAPAVADIPPPDSCGREGEACDNAPGPGVCRKARCGRATPEGSIDYDCLRCRPAPTERPQVAQPPPGVAAAAAGPSAEATPQQRKGSCAIAPRPAAASVALLLGAAGLLVLRRRAR